MPSQPFPTLFLLPALLLAPASGAGAAPTQTPATAAPAALTSDAASYCAAIRDPAAEARFAWQANQLKGLEAKLTETLKRLEERKAELQMLTDQRAAEVKQAEARMTDIFARMRPDAAALQLSAMDQSVAVAVLSKLPPRAASAVLNEMEASRAAQLAEVMGGRRSLPTSSSTGVQTR
ncbi:MAG: MotE family protein [Bosea sp. (in: a-proteobacteria)]|uniref:MotE family protein n=1 Tax=Bosea sp. (in: a-proteobacteria) TaxID=1871050 RepID=UPI00273256FA|nr:MotE family protein [Bosea sp. (in: a-proteobacteria)]MDP3254496.1 MotE family protein [Bosea sp. (in: a-proteobacteria)]MDP3320529.1 MotE family protein [Bosea sp. (in: a-proteobacteria)]